MRRITAIIALLVFALVLTAGAAAQARPATSDEIINFLLRSGTGKTFTDQPIDQKTLDLIVQCGIRAPSAQNKQPWHFSVIIGKKVMDQMREAMSSAPMPQPPAAGKDAPGAGAKEPPKEGAPAGGPPPGKRDMFFNSSTAIMISGLKDWQWASIDCSLACQNMSLAAQAFGYGAHISASATLLFSDPAKAAELKKTLGIPEGYEPLMMLVIGVPAKATDAMSQPSARNTKGVTTFVK